MTKKKLVQGVGINDLSEPIKEFINGYWVHKPVYRVWFNMLKRCYNESYQESQPTYKGWTVCEEWKSLSKFKDWFDFNWNSRVYNETYELDKDILNLGDTEYSPKTCRMIPHKLNTFILDSGSKRGEFMLGVTKHNEKFKAQCKCPFKGKNEYIGLFHTEHDAHIAWKSRKLEHAIKLCDMYSKIDNDILKSIIMRYTLNEEISKRR